MIVYALVDPATREVRYVGETRRKGATRLAQHIRTASGKTTPPVNAWIRGLSLRGLTPEMVEIESYHDEPSMMLGEAFWIEQLAAIGASLLNVAPGGRTRVGFRHSEETKARWRESRRGENAPMWGKRRTPEQKEVFRKLTKELWQRQDHPNKGKARSPETVEKMRAARARRPISEEHRAALAAGNARRWEKHRAEKLAGMGYEP